MEPYVTGDMVVELEAVKNLSPGRPVAPVIPVAPVAPVSPVAPTGPSTPSKFTLYITAVVYVPCIFTILPMVIAPVAAVYELTIPSNLFVTSVELITTTEFPGM
jgi:hypothetical protein